MITLRSGQFRINNKVLDVPPTDIQIIKHDFNIGVQTLRTPNSSSVKSGSKIVKIIVDTFFASGFDAENNKEVEMESWVNKQLGPLLIQIRKCPFVSIDNEKIRKEMFGLDLVEDFKEAETLNMAATVKSVSIFSKTKEPETLYIRFEMDWFNYLPYSKDFSYKDKETGRAVKMPGALFDEFVGAGVKFNDRFINYIDSSKGNDLEIIYKEYMYLSREEPVNLNKLTSVDFGSSETVQVPFKDKTGYYEDPYSSLKEEGWVVEDETEAAEREPGNLAYRYRRFKIPTSVKLDSGALVVESATISLSTNTPTIPLVGQVYPTSQFLGCSDGNIVLNLFANAEQEDEYPIGTSKKLGELIRILDSVSRNATSYKRVSKNDVVFIKHPMAKLLKYKPYKEKKIMVYDEEFKGTVPLELNEYLGCILDVTESQTVKGNPFCSRFSMSLTENYISDLEVIAEDDTGGTNRIYDATKKMVQTLSERFQIKREIDKFVIKNIEKRHEPDYPIADKYRRYLNASLKLKDFNLPSQALEDPFFNEKSDSEIDEEFRKEVVSDRSRFAGPVGVSGYSNAIFKGAYDVHQDSLKKGQRKTEDKQSLSYDRINEIANDIIKLNAKLGKEKGAAEQLVADYSPHMEPFVNYNLVKKESTYPDMLLPSNHQPDFYFFNSSEKDEEYKDKLLQKVFDRWGKARNQYMKEAVDPETSLPSRTDFMGAPGPASLAINPLIKPGKTTKDLEGIAKAFSQNPLNEGDQAINITRAVEEFKDGTYLMRRAMPAFKLFLKDGGVESISDTAKSRGTSSSKIWRNITDFYGVNSIIDVRLVKQPDNPARVMVIRIANMKEDLVNKRFEYPFDKLYSEKQKEQRSKSKDKTKKDRFLFEKELNGVMLKEGTRIELRTGYDSDPNKLEVEFTGRVSQVGGGDILEVVCQGDGIELVQELKGVGVGSETGDTFTWNSDTANLISELIHDSPEIASFGTRSAKTRIGEVDMLWRVAGGRTAVENIFAPSLFGTWDKFLDKTAMLASAGAAIFSFAGPQAALVGGILGGIAGLGYDALEAKKRLFRGSKFTIYEQTIWDVLQELTLRHPGTICQVIPFDRRNTIFFGYPDQMYFYRGPTYAEASNLEIGTSYAVAEKNLKEGFESKIGATLTGTTGIEGLRKKIDDQDSDAEALLSYLKPYRNYHMITAEHDIIENNMVVNSDEVFNSVQVMHPSLSFMDSEADIDLRGFSGYEKTDEIKADDDLNKEYIKRQTLIFHNAHKEVVDDLPERYAISSLTRSLANVYKGKIKILGRPGIKPHDILYVYDTYNDIYGPVEVGDVVDTISFQTGWVTEITPRMIVMPTSSMAYEHIKAIQRLTTSFYLKNAKMFYSGLLFNAQGEIANDIENTSALSALFNSSLFQGAKTGALISTTKVLGTRSVLDIGKKFTELGTTVKAGALAKFTAGRLFAGSLPLLGSLMLDYTSGWFINWSKYRQPIVILPVTRNGKPWYTGLHGLQNNTMLDAVEGEVAEVLDKGKYFLDYLGSNFTEIWGD